MHALANAIPRSRVVSVATIAHYCTSLVNRTSDRCWESWLGINTTGNAASFHPDAHRYGYLAYHTWFAIFDRLTLSADDVVMDLGCGKGRVVCAAAMYGIAESVGVEIDRALYDQAVTNAARLRRRRAPIRIVHAPAESVDFDPVTVVAMFNPFGAVTLNRVLDALEASLRRRPRTLRIVYANPELGKLLEARPWLDRHDGWQPGAWSRIKFPVDFYRHAPDEQT